MIFRSYVRLTPSCEITKSGTISRQRLCVAPLAGACIARSLAAAAAAGSSVVNSPDGS